MKQTVLLFILFSSFGLMAQNYYPQVVSTPRTGFMQLHQDNKYILSLVTNGGEWTPSIRYLHEKAPNIDYTGVDIYSVWEKGTWEDRNITTDSFVLDNQNRISVVYNKMISDYSGTVEKTKSKFVYYYNSSNQIERFDYSPAVSFNSNNYQKRSITYYFYNSNGKRILDSNIYYFTGGSQTNLTHYAYTGDKLNTVTQVHGSDTVRKAYYTYSGDLLLSTVSMDYDAGSDEWTTNYADTFEYNSKNQIIRNSSLGYVYRNGVLSIEPTGNDSYTYTSDGQLLEEIQRQWVGGTWVNFTKTIITYDANNKPIEGYEYEYVVNDWATAPRTKYLFGFQTGLTSVSNPLSEIVIAPNPATDILTIDLDTYEATITLFDITGKSVYEQTGVQGKHTIDVSSFDNGVYYALIQNEMSQVCKKIVVRH